MMLGNGIGVGRKVFFGWEVELFDELKRILGVVSPLLMIKKMNVCGIFVILRFTLSNLHIIFSCLMFC